MQTAEALEDALLRAVRELTQEQQREVLDFAAFLAGRRQEPKPADRLFGSLRHLNIDVSEDTIAEARKEMWGNFPREFPT